MRQNNKLPPGPPALATHPDLDDLLVRAKAGDAVALNELLEALRPLIRKWADGLVDPRLRIRKDASDLAQDTLLEFFRTFPQFAGKTQPELLAYLRRILERNHIDALRAQLHAAQRSLAVEVSLDAASPSAGVKDRLQAKITSPSGRLERKELTAQALEAMQRLPETQQEALMLWLQGYTFAEIAEEMHKTESAAQSLVKHALQTLRSQFPGVFGTESND